jgi:hypothetical protein
MLICGLFDLCQCATLQTPHRLYQYWIKSMGQRWYVGPTHSLPEPQGLGASFKANRGNPNRPAYHRGSAQNLTALVASGWTRVDRSEMAAVTVLRGNGGTFPSRTQKSDPQGRRQERVEGAHTERVLLHARSLCRAVCVVRPRLVRAEQTAFTEVPSFRALVNVCVKEPG